MFVRRFFAGVLLLGLAVPALAAAPHDNRTAKPSAPPPPAGMGSRVFARADSGPNAQISPAPPSAAPSALPGSGALGPSPEIAARARAEFDAHRAGKIDRSHYTSELNGFMTDAMIARASADLQGLGAVKNFAQVRRITHGATSIYVFHIECENAPILEETIAWDADGKVDYLSFGPAR